MPEWLTRLDFSVLYAIQDALRCGFLDFLMPKITWLGNNGLIWILAAVVLLCLKKRRRYGVLLLAGLAIGLLVGNIILKHAVARPRPCWLDPTVQLLIAVPRDYSFPSGHTMASVIGATVLTGADRRFAPVAIPLAVLIAFSRLYLFVHFPSDVLASVVIGLAIGGLMLFAHRQWMRRRRPTEAPSETPSETPPET